MFDGVRELGRRARGGYDNANLWIGPELRESDDWHDFLQSAYTAIDALEQADKSVDALVQAVAADKPEVVVDLGDISRRLHELAENLKLIIDGTDEHYVYSLQVNRRLRAGGESMTAERIDIGEALATEWLPEVHTAIFASATMTVSKSFEHFNHAVGLDRIGASTSSSLHLDSSYDFDSNMAVVVAGDIPDPRDRESYLTALERVLVDAHLAMGGSVLTLFTNRRDMEDLYARVEPKMARAGLELNCQQRNSSPRRLRDRFINEPTSSLFALRPSGRDSTPAARRCAASSFPSCRSRVPRTRSRASATCAKTALGRAIRCPRRCSRSSRRPAALSARRPIAAC